MIEQMWRSILASDEMGEALVASQEVDDVVALMIESKVVPQKFAGNLAALITKGMPTMGDMLCGGGPALPTTPSVNQYVSLFNRPLRTPLWFLAGFPDVLAWLNDKQRAFLNPSADEDEATTALAELYGFDLNSSDDLSEDDVWNPEGSLRACYYRNLVHNYVAQTGRKLEVAAVGRVQLAMHVLLFWICSR